jgi:GT2 family glycosyltransferase
MLIHRDLFRGLGGADPIMPSSAAVDFCQRARLRGARVVAVPSSVVRFEGRDPASPWRDRAGETRAMLSVRP